MILKILYKESAGDMVQAMQILKINQRFLVISGDDMIVLPMV
jgi:dihydrodipicolinate synthase/N-acetylneuraminate lyase